MERRLGRAWKEGYCGDMWKGNCGVGVWRGGCGVEVEGWRGGGLSTDIKKVKSEGMEKRLNWYCGRKAVERDVEWRVRGRC